MKPAPRLDAVVAHVLAWHNRHPLARRIKVSEVGSIGLVAMPFVAPAGGTGLPVAAFSEDFLQPLKPAVVGRWAAQQGYVSAEAPAGVPLRQVTVDADRVVSTGSTTITLLVATAALEVGKQHRRLLVGQGDPAAVLGKRIWSRPRMAAASVLALALLTVPLALPWVGGAMGGGSTPVLARSAAPTANAASGAAAAAAAAAQASAAAPPPVTLATVVLPDRAHPDPAATEAEVPTSHEPLSPPHSPSASASAVAASAVPPAPVAATPRRQHGSALVGGVTRPVIRPTLDDDAKAEARLAVADARLALGLPEQPARFAQAAQAAQASSGPGAHPTAAALVRVSAAHGSLQANPASAANAGGRSRPTLVDAGPAFALSSRLLRTRAEAEQVMAAVQALLLTIRDKDSAPLQVEMVPVGDDWRVAAFPFPRQREADQARVLLASRGMRVSVVDF